MCDAVQRPNPISPDRIWRDPEVLAARTGARYKEMSIDGSGIPFRLGTAVNLVLALEESRTKAIPGFKLPFCILHGTQDEGVPISGSEFMWDTAETPEADRSFHRIDGAFHDLFGDPKAEECMKIVVDWIAKRISK
jgi:alpha-beta hydrolase superfamily lysophospholipase